MVDLRGCWAATPPSERRRACSSAPRTTVVVRMMLAGLTLIESIPSPVRKRDLRIVGGRLTANADMAAISLGTRHREAQHLQHSGIALVEIVGDDFRSSGTVFSRSRLSTQAASSQAYRRVGFNPVSQKPREVQKA